MRLLNAFLTVIIGFSAISSCARDEARLAASLIYTNVAPAKSDKQWPIYEDSAVKMIAVGYGDASKQSKPGFYVFRKVTVDWIRIDKISTRGATFGRSPAFEEVKKAGTTIPSIGWNFQNLAKETYVDFPLQSAGFLFFPDKVEQDKKRKEYLLRFNSGWKIEGVETVLRLSIDELWKRDLEQSSGGDSLKAAPQE